MDVVVTLVRRPHKPAVAGCGGGGDATRSGGFSATTTALQRQSKQKALLVYEYCDGGYDGHELLRHGHGDMVMVIGMVMVRVVVVIAVVFVMVEK